MRNMKKIFRNPFKLDPYSTRVRRIGILSRPETVYAWSIVNFIAIAFFCTVDLFCLKIIWNEVQTSNPVFVWLLAIACAIGLDVPLAIAAFAMKKYKQGLSDKKSRDIIVILSLVVFAIAFIFSFVFRIYTKDLTFELSDGSYIQDTMAETSVNTTNGDSSVILVAALFNGVIPLITSISSFVISYFSSNPLGLRLVRCEKEKVRIQTNLLDANQALIEAETSEEYCRRLKARENDLFNDFIGQLDARALDLKQFVRVLIMEKVSNPDQITNVTNTSYNLKEKYDEKGQPEKEMEAFIEDDLGGNEKIENTIFESEPNIA